MTHAESEAKCYIIKHVLYIDLCMALQDADLMSSCWFYCLNWRLIQHL